MGVHTRSGHERVTVPPILTHPDPSRFFKSSLIAVAMSLTGDDLGNIRELHAKGSGLGRDYRDASSGTAAAQYVKPFTPAYQTHFVCT
jgi:hypothetical protein